MGKYSRAASIVLGSSFTSVYAAAEELPHSLQFSEPMRYVLQAQDIPTEEALLEARIMRMFDLPLEHKADIQDIQPRIVFDPSQRPATLKTSYGWVPGHAMGIIFDVRGLDDYLRCEKEQGCRLQEVHVNALGIGLRRRF